MQRRSLPVLPTFPGNALLSRPCRIIRDNRSLRVQYDSLSNGDIVIGRIRVRPLEEALLLDLVERGVKIFPSARAQLASRSKTFQTLLFSSFMPPHTRAVHDIHDLLQVLNHYGESGISRVVTKQDRSNAGMGIHLWHSIEDVYSQASFGVLPFPFVVQPFCSGSRDIRVVLLGDYVEAYWRKNPYNFRNNLHFGGESNPCDLSRKHMALCGEIMERAGFPYAHIDLMVTDHYETYLAEINLRGGIRGARISPAEYRAKVEAIHETALKAFLDTG